MIFTIFAFALLSFIDCALDCSGYGTGSHMTCDEIRGCTWSDTKNTTCSPCSDALNHKTCFGGCKNSNSGCKAASCGDYGAYIKGANEDYKKEHGNYDDETYKRECKESGCSWSKSSHGCGMSNGSAAAIAVVVVVLVLLVLVVIGLIVFYIYKKKGGWSGFRSSSYQGFAPQVAPQLLPQQGVPPQQGGIPPQQYSQPNTYSGGFQQGPAAPVQPVQPVQPAVSGFQGQIGAPPSQAPSGV